MEARGEHVESGGPPSNNYIAVVSFLERAGVIFITSDAEAGEGVRLAHPDEESRDIAERILLPADGVRLRKQDD